MMRTDRFRLSFRTPLDYGWQLKFAMRVCLPIHAGEYRDAWWQIRCAADEVAAALWAVWVIVFRFALLALYPVAVPLVAYVNMRIARRELDAPPESAAQQWLARKRSMEAQMVAETERTHD